jgi:hypothetical protein
MFIKISLELRFFKPDFEGVVKAEPGKSRRSGRQTVGRKEVLYIRYSA